MKPETALLIIALWMVTAYNGLIALKNETLNALKQIDVQLKRRHDLIPNLVETVKGYAAHEQSTFDAVIKARQAAISAPSTPAAQAGADNAVTGALRQLFALSEAYPDLKANQNFLALQEELTATENKISFARQFYNDSVNAYNNRRQSFPAVLAAQSMGFGPVPLFSMR